MGIQINGQTDRISAVDGTMTFPGTVTYEDVSRVNVTGVSTFAANVHVSDSIAHLGDIDTSIRFPAADTFTVETAGSERLRITSAGLVGIGTDTPAAKLEVATSVDGEATLATFKNTSKGGINETVDIALGLEGNSTTSNVVLRAGKEANHGSGAAADNFFAIHTTLDNTSSEKLRIDSSGRLLVGNSTATINEAKIEAYADNTGNADVLCLYNKDTATGNTANILFAPSNTVAGARIICEAMEDFSTSANRTADLAFVTRKDGTLSEKLRITSGGAVLGPQKYSGSYTASSNLDITGFGLGNYMVNVRSVGTYHWNGVLLVTMFDTADYGVATLVSGNYQTTITTSMVNLGVGSGTLRLVFNRDFGSITVRVLQIG